MGAAEGRLSRGIAAAAGGTLVLALLGLLALLALLGCTGSASSGGVRSSTGSPSTGMAGEAAAAYVDYVRAASVAERHPPRLGDPVDPAADYTRFSFNPVRGQEAQYLSYLVDNHLALRGTPPAAHPAVVSLRIHDEPYPTVVLTDCLATPADWRRYDVRTGALVPVPQDTLPTQPTRIEVVYLQGHWGVRTIEPVPGQTCSG